MNTKDMFDPFNLALAEALKTMGIESAEDAKQDTLKLGRIFVLQAANRRMNKTATADDAARGFSALGMPANSLGNAAGALFRGKAWSFTGQWKKSKRISNHAHSNRVWKLTGENNE